MYHWSKYALLSNENCQSFNIYVQTSNVTVTIWWSEIYEPKINALNSNTNYFSHHFTLALMLTVSPSISSYHTECHAGIKSEKILSYSKFLIHNLHLKISASLAIGSGPVGHFWLHSASDSAHHGGNGEIFSLKTDFTTEYRTVIDPSLWCMVGSWKVIKVLLAAN